MILTDDIIEKAARGMYERWSADFDETAPPWGGASSASCEHWGNLARAALEAVLPDVVEAAAKVAENYRHPNPFPTVYDAIATAIRSLAKRDES